MPVSSRPITREDILFMLTILGSIVSMVVWGVGLNGRVDALDEKYAQVKSNTEIIHQIDKRTEVMNVNLENLLKHFDVSPTQ